MVRTTFGRSGEPIKIVDDDSGAVDGEVIEPTVIDDHSGADVEFIRVTGDGDGEASGETGEDTGEVGSRTTYTDPTNISARTGKPKRKWSRRSRTATATTATATDASTADKTAVITGHLERVLFNLHVMGAALLNEPRIKRSETDCAMLAEAVKDVAAAHDVMKAVDPKTLAWIQLVVVLIIVYGGESIVEMFTGKKTRGTMTIMPPAQAGD